MIETERKYKNVWYYYTPESELFQKGWHCGMKVFKTEVEVKEYIDNLQYEHDMAVLSRAVELALNK